jgi:HD-like signal output (HDOD) protein
LWKHSVAVAHAASLVAKVNKSSSSNEAYTAGLLHHLGTILIDQYLHQDFRRILQKLAVDVPTCDVEQQVLTFDHGQLASHLARRWAFPRDICEALRFYLYLESYTGPGRRLAIILAIADYLCASFGWTSLGIANVPAPAASVCEELGLDEAALTALQDQVWTDVARDMA